MTIPDPPGTEPGYLEQAADQLRQARAANEKRRGRAEAMHSGQAEDQERILAEVNVRRMEIAEGYTRLAAIERNLPPCCGHHAQPGQEPQP